MKWFEKKEGEPPPYKCPNCRRPVYELYDVNAGVGTWRVCGDCANIIDKHLKVQNG